LVSAASALADDEHAVLPPLTKITTIASTVPGNGDVNPYGVAQVKRTTGKLSAGHILISNFNDSNNAQWLPQSAAWPSNNIGVSEVFVYGCQ
jgi:hypothetical protein